MNARERANRRGGRPIPAAPTGPPQTVYDAAMARQDETALAIWIMESRLARLGQAVCMIGAAVAYFKAGVPAALVGLFLAWLFGLARPGPNERLDQFTNRKGR